MPDPDLPPEPLPVPPVPPPESVFTPEQIKEDGRNRVARTGVQGFSAAGGVVLTRYVMQRYLPQHLPPDDVLLILVGAGAWLASRIANHARLQGRL